MEEIFKGGNSKSRNPRMQTMLRMIGFGDNAGSGFPAILAVWKNAGWEEPALKEDTTLNQVTLILKIKSAEKSAEFKYIDRAEQILCMMEDGSEYSANQIAEKIGLKGSRTRQLLKELVEQEKIKCIGVTKKRKYIKNLLL